MKKLDWIIVVLLTFMGLSCLSMSLTLTNEIPTLNVYVSSLLKVCMWFGIPFLVVAVVYWLVKRK